MTDPAVTTERRGDIAIVRFDRQGRGNALSFPILDALTETAHTLARDRSLAAVVFTGAHPGQGLLGARLDERTGFADSRHNPAVKRAPGERQEQKNGQQQTQ